MESNLEYNAKHNRAILNDKKRRKSGKILAYALLLIFGSLFIFPFLWMISTSLKSLTE